ncbi:MAG: SDR family oxidoreductase [Oscillospiraceae bacterium]|jgi:gluconate 5-dehydrogenase|nr:SDR family oxidoreductase [Oscillospiraceae bacterium]
MSNLFDLTGKAAVVVGGAGGIGQSLAQGLVEAGATVVISSRREDALKTAVAEIKAATGKEVFYAAGDATDEADVEKLLASAIAQAGKISILVNAQGFNKKQDALDFDIAVFNQMLTANITSFMVTAKVFGKHFKENGYGKIINLSSVRGKIATKGPGNAGYCATKGAVDMLTKQLASEYGPFGVTVNAIGPNITATPMMVEIFKKRAEDAGVSVEQYLKEQGAGLPMRRMATPEDCVGTVVYLAAPASDFLTGNILYPDGGLTAIG